VSRKRLFTILLVSFLCFVIPIPLATQLWGYGGHNVKFLVVILLYFFVTQKFLKETVSKSQRITIVGIIILFPLLFYTPLHIVDFKSTLLSLPSSVAHFLGISLGVLCFYGSKTTRLITTVSILSFGIWGMSTGYSLWIHYIEYGTLFSETHDIAPNYTFVDPAGKISKKEAFKKDYVVLDFWQTSCGVCFTKFPLVQQLYLKSLKSKNFSVYSINIPIKRDLTRTAFEVIKEQGYTFPVLKNIDNNFDIRAFPTVLIINNGIIVYKGDIENAELFIDKL
jgi:thiol-disulfide isomerase/thioredoxin